MPITIDRDLSGDETQIKKIVSFDGGGIRGYFTARLLEALETYMDGQHLGRHVDLVAGTSTGSIVASGVAMGYSAREIADLFRQRGPEIFPGQASRLWSWASNVFSRGVDMPKYDGAGLDNVLQEVCMDARLGDMKGPLLMVTAYDLMARKAVVFKSFRGRHQPLMLWEVVRSSCSAPTYFPAHEIEYREPMQDEQTPDDELQPRRTALIDGGVVANNPTACALAEARRVNGQRGDQLPVSRLVIGSFGSGSLTREISVSEGQEWGILGWGSGPIVDVMFDGGADAVDYVVRNLTSPRRYFRFQARLTEALDNIDVVTNGNYRDLDRLAQDYLHRDDVRKRLRALARLLTQ